MIQGLIVKMAEILNCDGTKAFRVWLSFMSVKMALNGKGYVGTLHIGIGTMSLETVAAKRISKPPELATGQTLNYRPHIKIICRLLKPLSC